MRIIWAVGLMLAATAADAAPSELLKCDGYGGRRGTGESVVRGLAIIATLGILGSPEGDDPSVRLQGRAGAAACTAALTDERVKGNAVRRSEVYLALAIHYLGSDSPQDAIDNAELARQMAVTPEQRPVFDRTIVPSALLVQAYAKLAQGKQDEAEALAALAIAARPYGQLINDYALEIMALTPAISPPEAASLERRLRVLATGPWQRSQKRIAAGDFAGAVADLKMSVALDVAKRPDLVAEATLATAYAVAGKTSDAMTMLDVVKEHSDLAAAGANSAEDEALRVQRADEIVRLARIQLALNRGDVAEAKIIITSQTRWLAPPPLVAAVLANTRAKGVMTPDDPAKLVDNAIVASRKKLIGSDFAQILIARLPRWEDEGDWRRLAKEFDSGKSAVKSERRADRPGTSVSFVTLEGAFADSVSEAALVAISRIAGAAGVDKFAISRTNRFYSGYNRTASYGVSRVGAMVNLQLIDWLKSGDATWESQAGRTLSVADIERDLGSLYPKPVPPAAR